MSILYMPCVVRKADGSPGFDFEPCTSQTCTASTGACHRNSHARSINYAYLKLKRVETDVGEYPAASSTVQGVPTVQCGTAALCVAVRLTSVAACSTADDVSQSGSG
jgi:hypothetical protein